MQGQCRGSNPTLGWLCQEVDFPKAHPDVIAGVVSLKEALFCFFAAWGVKLEHSVSQTLFEQFWSDWSVAFVGDQEFAQFMYRLFRYDANAVADDSIIDSGAPLVPDRAAADKVFKQIDVNGNGTLSLAELDLAVIRLWPQFNNKPAIMRAYKLADASGNGWLDKEEFFAFLRYLAAYGNLFKRFHQVDTDRSGNISLDELKQHKKLLGLGKESDVSLRAIFKSIDTNNGGKILFEEFCMYMAKREGKMDMVKDTNQY